MAPLKIIAVAIGLFIVLPVVSYMVVKFGAAGFYRAKRQFNKKKDNE